ncbi:hypothetical protein MPC1_10550001 [Methylocella tundrae]|nr:hypothetical protein [Methylocella tundrae]VTZ21296.1 hypothetical protein MPC1_10550001 [Methylocella tundrae]
MGGDDDDREALVMPVEAAQHFIAAEVGHSHIQDHSIWRRADDPVEAGPASFGFGDVKSRIRQDIAHRPSHIPIIVNQQDRGALGHHITSLGMRT